MSSTGRRLAALARSWAARAGIAAITVLTCLLGVSTPAAMADPTTAIYTGTDTTTAALTDGSLTHTTYFTASNRGGGIAESNRSAAAGSSPALSIVDIDEFVDLNAVVELSNTGDEPIDDLDVAVALPSSYPAETGAPRLLVDAARLGTGKDGLSPDSDTTGVEIAYGSSTESFSPYDEWSASTGGDWSALQALEFTGTLSPGETFTLTIPLSLANQDELDLTRVSWVGIDERVLSPAGADASTRIRFARRVTDAEGTSPLTSTGQYRASSNAPDAIQSLMPTMQASDLTVSNIATDDASDAHAASADDRLFTGGTVSLGLARVKSAIRNAGWQVEPDESTSDGLAASYTYASDVLHSTDATSGGALNGATVQVRQVISAVSSTVPLGASWSPADNLGWIHDHAGSDVGVDSSDVRVETNVDTATPGVYQATYYYAPRAYYGSGGYEAAVTVEVAVTASASATITGTTTLEGGELQEGQFTFQMTDASGDLVATTTNLADGSFAFTPPQFDHDSIGSSTEYTIVEVVPDGAGDAGDDGTVTRDRITYDTHTEHVEVRVSADESGTNPVATIITDPDGVVFSNIQGSDTPSPSPSASSAPSPGASPDPDASASGGPAAESTQEEPSGGTIPLISAESSALVMGAGVVMVTVGTAMGLHGKRH